MMLLRCVICNRPLEKSEFFIGIYPVGPTCAKNRGLIGSSYKFKPSQSVRNDQLDLFGDANDEKKSINE